MPRPKGTVLTPEQKERMAHGRAVDQYLRYLANPNQAEPAQEVVTQAAIGKRVETLRGQLDKTTAPIRRLQLIQQIREAQTGRWEPKRRGPQPQKKSPEEREAEFVAALKATQGYGADYETWIDMGLPEATLKKAGLKPSRAA